MSSNVNRLSCRPPAGAGVQPTSTFYSRASPVNCSRWLGAGSTGQERLRPVVPYVFVVIGGRMDVAPIAA